MRDLGDEDHVASADRDTGRGAGPPLVADALTQTLGHKVRDETSRRLRSVGILWRLL